MSFDGCSVIGGSGWSYCRIDPDAFRSTRRRGHRVRQAHTRIPCSTRRRWRTFKAHFVQQTACLRFRLALRPRRTFFLRWGIPGARPYPRGRPRLMSDAERLNRCSLKLLWLNIWGTDTTRRALFRLTSTHAYEVRASLIRALTAQGLPAAKEQTRIPKSDCWVINDEKSRVYLRQALHPCRAAPLPWAWRGEA